MSSNSSTTDFSPDTTVPTNATVPRKDTTRVTPSDNGDEFILYAMTIVVGVVVLIILIIIIVFVMRSRHRKRKNLRRYNERQQRAPTLSLEIIDREDSPRETVNGVHNELYDQDYRLPVTVFDNQSNQGQTHIQPTETNPTQENQLDSNSSDRQSQSVPNQCDTSSAQTDDNADKSAPVYENTNVSKQKVSTVSEQMEQRKAQTTTHDREEKKILETSSDYETAFPMPVDQSKQVYENITTNNPAQTDIIPPAYVETTDDKHNDTNQLHSKLGKDKIGVGSTVNKDNFVSKAEKPKPVVKPKTGKEIRRCTDQSNSQGKKTENDNDEIHDYENSLKKVTTSTLQQAKLLKSVPPPCNAHPYVNVPDIDILEDVSAKPVQRQSSEYEDPENVFSLNKHKNLKSKLHEKKFKNTHVKSPNPSSTESERDEPMSKTVKSKSNARDISQSGIKHKQNKSRDKSTGGPKPVYANINEKNETGLKPPDSEIFDYENEDTVKELKSTLRMLGKRGFSTSSLETRKQESSLKTGMNKKKARTGSDISKESDDVYLPMGVLENEDDDYLKMEDLNDDVYMPMVTPEEGVYMRMESNSISSKRFEKNGQQKFSVRQFNSPRGYLTTPKPCGGTRSVGYVNFSDQPVKYVNFFRSRSSDDVYTNCADGYTKMRYSKS